jgi:hypothetical protein
MVDLEGKFATQHDTIDVEGEVELGGTVHFAIPPTSTLAAGDTFTFLTAPEMVSMAVFDQVQTSGSDSLFVAIEYPNLAPGSGAVLPDEFQLRGHVYQRGDMNHDSYILSADTMIEGVLYKSDIPYFAMALSDRQKYFNARLSNGACICDFGQAAGDLGSPAGSDSEGKYHSDGKLTFDDIKAFAAKLNISEGAFLAGMQSVPEPSSIMLIFAGSAILLTRYARRAHWRSVRHRCIGTR